MIDTILIANGKPEEYDKIDKIIEQQGFMHLQRRPKCFARANDPPLTQNKMDRIRADLINRVGDHLEITFVDGDTDSYIQDNI